MGHENSQNTDTQKPEIIIQIEGKDLMTMSNDGIKIHRENFPDFEPDDFVQAFLDILERHINVKFESNKAEFRPHAQ